VERSQSTKEMVAAYGTVTSSAALGRRRNLEDVMRKLIVLAVAMGLLSSAAMAQSADTKGPATTGPAAQSDNMSKGDMSKGSMTKKKMSKAKMKKNEKM
jgi:hypothetical protein